MENFPELGSTHLYPIRPPYWSTRIKFALVHYDHEGHATAAQPVTMEPVAVGEEYPVTFSLDAIEAQALVDQLWDCGFRPSEGTGSAGALAATQQHLKDMQQISFKLLEKVIAE